MWEDEDSEQEIMIALAHLRLHYNFLIIKAVITAHT